MKKQFWTITFAVILFASCNDNNDYDISLRINGITEINVGETVGNARHNLSLRVEKINDSRCNVEGLLCVWAGNATVELHLTTKNGQHDFTLDTHPGGSFRNDTIIESIKYSLVNVLPERRVSFDERGETAVIRTEHQ